MPLLRAVLDLTASIPSKERFYLPSMILGSMLVVANTNAN